MRSQFAFSVFVALIAIAGPLQIVPEVPAHHHAPIQPGAEMTAPSGCTMNFVFKDQSNKLYIGTAGHCVGNQGQSVSLRGVGPIGTVAWKGAGVDFALVSIVPALSGLVNPAVRHWGGPTGVANAPSTILGAQGLPIYHYGYGLGPGASELSRPRVGVLTLQNSERFLAETSATFGDSGSPFILATDGRALGVVSEFALGLGHTDQGPTVQFILARAQIEKGLTLTLQTAPLADPVARETARVGHSPIG